MTKMCPFILNYKVENKNFNGTDGGCNQEI